MNFPQCTKIKRRCAALRRNVVSQEVAHGWVLLLFFFHFRFGYEIMLYGCCKKHSLGRSTACLGGDWFPGHEIMLFRCCKKLAREKHRILRGCLVHLGTLCPPREKMAVAPTCSCLVQSTKSNPAACTQHAAYLYPMCCCLAASHSCGVSRSRNFLWTRRCLGSVSPYRFQNVRTVNLRYTIHLCNVSLCVGLEELEEFLS